MLTRITFSLLIISTVAFGAPISRVTDFVDGNVLTASQLNSEFNNVLSGVNSITNAQIASNAQISPTKLSASIKGTAIARDSGTGALSVKVDDSTIQNTGDNLALKDAGITAAKLAADSVTTASILDGSVTTAKLADGAVTQVKRAALGQQISASSGSWSTTSAFNMDVTNLNVTITTTGRPIFIGLISVQSSSSAYVRTFTTNGQLAYSAVRFVEGSSNVLSAQSFGIRTELGSATNDPLSSMPCSAFSTIAILTAGTYTFKTQVDLSATQADVQDCRMIAYEL